MIARDFTLGILFFSKVLLHFTLASFTVSSYLAVNIKWLINNIINRKVRIISTLRFKERYRTRTTLFNELSIKLLAVYFYMDNYVQFTITERNNNELRRVCCRGIRNAKNLLVRS